MTSVLTIIVRFFSPCRGVRTVPSNRAPKVEGRKILKNKQTTFFLRNFKKKRERNGHSRTLWQSSNKVVGAAKTNIEVVDQIR